ncbi:MAG TPA: surface-adhesin E family protein [Methylophilaceae bacterium]|jgi:hypothetical protein
MKRTLAPLLLAFASTATATDLLQLSSNQKEVAYAERNTIRKSGDIVSMWSLYDLKRTQYIARKPYQSIKYQMDYHCRKQQVRIRGWRYYSGKMGEGELVWKDSFTDIWTPITGVEPEWHFACNQTAEFHAGQ